MVHSVAHDAHLECYKACGFTKPVLLSCASVQGENGLCQLYINHCVVSEGCSKMDKMC